MHHLHRLYRQHLLEKALYALAAPGGTGNVAGRQTADVLPLVQILSEQAAPPSEAHPFTAHACNEESPPSEDEHALWWASVVAVATHWLLAEDAQAEALYSRIEALPTALTSLADPLPLAIRAAFRTKRAMSKTLTARHVRDLADRAGLLLEQSLSCAACRPPSKLTLVRP